MHQLAESDFWYYVTIMGSRTRYCESVVTSVCKLTLLVTLRPIHCKDDQQSQWKNLNFDSAISRYACAYAYIIIAYSELTNCVNAVASLSSRLNKWVVDFGSKLPIITMVPIESACANSYLWSTLRVSRYMVANGQKSPIRTYRVSFNAPCRLRATLSNFGMNPIFAKISLSVKKTWLCSFWYNTRVWQMDIRTALL